MFLLCWQRGSARYRSARTCVFMCVVCACLSACVYLFACIRECRVFLLRRADIVMVLSTPRIHTKCMFVFPSQTSNAGISLITEFYRNRRRREPIGTRVCADVHHIGLGAAVHGAAPAAAADRSDSCDVVGGMRF